MCRQPSALDLLLTTEQHVISADDDGNYRGHREHGAGIDWRVAESHRRCPTFSLIAQKEAVISPFLNALQKIKRKKDTRNGNLVEDEKSVRFILCVPRTSVQTLMEIRQTVVEVSQTELILRTICMNVYPSTA